MIPATAVHRRTSCNLATLCLTLLATSAVGQIDRPCEPRWIPGHGVPGIAGYVQAMTHWDPDGPGPRPSVVVVGGNFSLAGSSVASNIAIYHPASGHWSPLDTGHEFAASSVIYALAAAPNGDLLVGGEFTTAGGVSAARIARWTGSAWLPVGTGAHDYLRAIHTLPNGDIIAQGVFYTSPQDRYRIARWDGSAWSGLTGAAPSLSPASPDCSVLHPDGHLLVGGRFSQSNNTSAIHVGRWDGSTWSALGGAFNDWIFDLEVLPNGDIVAAGDFTAIGQLQVNRVARWTGDSWVPLGPGSPDPIMSLAVLPNGDIVTAATSATSAPFNSRIRRWNGSSWSTLGHSDNFANHLLVFPDGSLLAGGTFTAIDSVVASSIARFDSSGWSSLAAGTNGLVRTQVLCADGTLIAGGEFTTVGHDGTPANFIGRRSS